MSQETEGVNYAVVRRCMWAFENDSAEFRATLHPEIEWFPIDENRQRLYGIEAALRNRNEWLDTWDEHQIEMEEVASEGDSVVVLIHITARGRISGAEVDLRFYPHFKLRDDKVIYIYDHADGAAALEAAGLSE